MSDSAIQTEKGAWTLISGHQPDNLDQFDELVRKARDAQANAYSPYSKFRVGAAALVEGSIYTGCNVENASYGGTMCAERTAMFSAVADGSRKLEIMAITTDARDEAIESRSPCGLCRQIMSEFADDDTIILLDSGPTGGFEYSGEVILFKDLLPWRFKLS